ncbi:hypothetical protein B0H13DRAFT_1864337 [Mycena leptocephala]|nr:hypothetical protein B0H13DRAFT_1864337 [Mycena leptocephala]
MLGFNKFIQMRFDPAVIKYGYRPLIEVRILGLYPRNSGPNYELRVPTSQFIRDRLHAVMNATRYLRIAILKLQDCVGNSTHSLRERDKGDAGNGERVRGTAAEDRTRGAARAARRAGGDGLRIGAAYARRHHPLRRIRSSRASWSRGGIRNDEHLLWPLHTRVVVRTGLPVQEWHWSVYAEKYAKGGYCGKGRRSTAAVSCAANGDGAVRRPAERDKWPSGVWGASVAGNPENQGAVQSKMRWRCAARCGDAPKRRARRAVTVGVRPRRAWCARDEYRRYRRRRRGGKSKVRTASAAGSDVCDSQCAAVRVLSDRCASAGRRARGGTPASKLFREKPRRVASGIGRRVQRISVKALSMYARARVRRQRRGGSDPSQGTRGVRWWVQTAPTPRDPLLELRIQAGNVGDSGREELRRCMGMMVREGYKERRRASGGCEASGRRRKFEIPPGQGEVARRDDIDGAEGERSQCRSGLIVLYARGYHSYKGKPQKRNDIGARSFGEGIENNGTNTNLAFRESKNKRDNRGPSSNGYPSNGRAEDCPAKGQH